ncbi:hypothetical protein A3840_17130 [Devosia elaeis]|uniref:Uncharacterized protein n=2 Tax=Devosia elaeis TaxID=1770058 RepID=A0A178HLL7_9HYPH|nr:hypothetical protein A3840_17130 [Devosia elaeis]
MLGDLEAEVETLGAVNAALDEQVVDLGRELDKSSKALSSAEAQIVARDRKIEKLTAQLSEKEMVAQRQLAAAMKGFEQKLSLLAENMLSAKTARVNTTGDST